MAGYTPVPQTEAIEHAANPATSCPSLGYLMVINSFAFAYSLVAATLGVVILPSESVHLFLDRLATSRTARLLSTGDGGLCLWPALCYLA